MEITYAECEMIAAHQPTIFGGKVVAAVSSKVDGDMSFGREDNATIIQNRVRLLKKIGANSNHTTLVRIGYENAEHFARYKIVTDDHKAEGMHGPTELLADALVVTQPGHALFLPLADCTGIILYDPTKHILMVSHVGRHSAEIDGAKRSVEYLKTQFGCDPRTLKVWLSPAVGKAAYPLHKKDGKGLHEVILEQLEQAGIAKINLEISDVDTATHQDYFSHSQYQAGARDVDGRFAIVAMMPEQGEPAF